LHPVAIKLSLIPAKEATVLSFTIPADNNIYSARPMVAAGLSSMKKSLTAK